MSIKSWSLSGLHLYEKCPRAARYRYVDRIPVPEPTPDSPMGRGTRIHELAEKFVRGEIEFPEELVQFKEDFEQLPKDTKFYMEEEWGYNPQWQPVPYNEAWLKAKLDLGYYLNKSEFKVIDYKTGKKDGNEIKHTDQAQLYACAVITRFPMIEFVHTEFWYIDKGQKLKGRYHRDKLEQFKKTFTLRANRMTCDERFIPKPNKYACKWCDFRDICESSAAT